MNGNHGADSAETAELSRVGDSRSYHRYKDDRDTRRRSRSPRRGDRRGNDRSNRDPYSSSRDYREREREDRYRDRRDERDWDRGDRRDRGDRFNRRDRRDDDRPPRRDRGDRDLFDDRRGGGRRDEDRNRGGPARGGPPPARRSESPRPQHREPTPDLTGVTSILERKRRQTNWDIKPPGYENVTAEQAKLSGMFPLPGAPRQQTMDPARLQALISQPADAASQNSLSISQARQSRRLFVENFPSTMDENAMKDFWNLQLNDLDCVSSHDPCIVCKMSPDRRVAMVEFKTPEDGTLALAMDGILMEDQANGDANGDANGAAKGAVVRRPKDYIIPVYPEDAEVKPNAVLDGPEKVMITGIPTMLQPDQVMELLGAFGEVKAKSVPKDKFEGTIRGMAFIEYQDKETTEAALENLNGMELAGSLLAARRSNIGIRQAAGIETQGASGLNMLASMPSTADRPTSRAICLYNLVDVNDLYNDEDYSDLKEDIVEELVKHGKIIDCKIPRPTTGNRDNPGIGKAYVKYENLEGADQAAKALSHRIFDGRTVLVAHFGEDYFDVEAW